MGTTAKKIMSVNKPLIWNASLWESIWEMKKCKFRATAEQCFSFLTRVHERTPRDDALAGLCVFTDWCKDTWFLCPAAESAECEKGGGRWRLPGLRSRLTCFFIHPPCPSLPSRHPSPLPILSLLGVRDANKWPWNAALGLESRSDDL